MVCVPDLDRGWVCDPFPGFVIEQDFLNYLLNRAEEAATCEQSLGVDLPMPGGADALVLPQDAPSRAFWFGMGFSAGVIVAFTSILLVVFAQ